LEGAVHGLVKRRKGGLANLGPLGLANGHTIEKNDYAEATKRKESRNCLREMGEEEGRR